MNPVLDRIFDTLGGDATWPLTVFVFVAVAGLTLAVGNVVRARGAIRRRATHAGIGAPTIVFDGDPLDDPRALGSDTRRSTKAMLDAIANHFTPTDRHEQTRVKRLLVQAGFFQSNAANWYLASRVGLAIGFGLAGLGLVPELLTTLSDSLQWLVIGAVGVAGYLIPTFYLSKRTQRLQIEYRTGFPDFMDLMVICADAGLAMEAAMDRVGRELAVTYPALSANIAMTTLEMRAGRTLSEALEHLADRLGIEEARSFATLLQQSEELGSSMTEALRVYSDDMRHKRMSRAEEKAYALPAKLVIPLGLFIFPIILVVTLLPVIVRVKTGTF